MTLLDERKILILQAIVDDYVETTRPVGSERLIDKYKFGCKSATMRNEMAELADLGYVVQPHTSAGRIPTDRGYRFYVDELMEPTNEAGTAAQKRARNLVAESASEVAQVVQRTCRLLAEMTSYASIATDPITDHVTARKLYLTEGDERHVLLVVLMSSGHVEHRLVETDTRLGPDLLSLASAYLNASFAGMQLDILATAPSTVEVDGELQQVGVLLHRVVPHVLNIANKLQQRKVYIDGASQLIRQPEFQDIGRLELILNALDETAILYRILSVAVDYNDTAIVIGTENKSPYMQECSVISTTYFIGNQRAGYLGVVGPTRMHYKSAMASVKLMAHNLSVVLTGLSLA